MIFFDNNRMQVAENREETRQLLSLVYAPRICQKRPAKPPASDNNDSNNNQFSSHYNDLMAKNR